MSIERFYNFRGGYATSTPPEAMEDEMVTTGTNIYYDANLKKRPSWTNYCVATEITDKVVLGMTTAYMRSAWRTILVINDGGTVKFWHVASATTVTEITDPDSAAFTLTATTDVQMVEFNDQVVAVNGTDKPVVVYDDGTKISVNWLEAYDTRSRGNDDWYAGQWDNSGATADLQFIDDTTDAQDAGTSDFQLAAANQNNDGFYVAGVLPFTKVIMTNSDAFSSEPSDEVYEYYAGSGTWSSVTLVSSPTWGTGGGNKTIEFNIPLDSDGDLAWKKYGDVSTDKDPDNGEAGSTLNRYIFRVRFVTAPTNTPDCDKLTVSHEQYLSQLFQNDIPDVVAVHGDRCFLASGNVYAKTLGGSNGLKGWSSRDFDYTREGGDNIIAMYSGGQFLAIIKEFGYYRLYGTTTGNANLRFGGPEGGVSTRGICGLKDGVAFLGKDGVYYLPYQGDASMITKAILSDLSPADGDLLLNWEGNILMSDPSADTMWWADPDTLRQDDMGDYTMSWWKWTGLNAENMIYGYDAVGSARQLIIYDHDNTRLVKDGALAYDTDKADATTNISCTLQTKYYAFGTPATKKRYIRLIVDLSKSGDWTLTMISDNGVTTSTAYTVSSSTGTGHYYEDISIPWEQDGYNIAFKLTNQTANAVQVYGLSVELERRAF